MPVGVAKVRPALAPGLVLRRPNLVRAGIPQLLGCTVSVVGVEAELEVAARVLGAMLRDSDAEWLEPEKGEYGLAFFGPAVRQLKAERLRRSRTRSETARESSDSYSSQGTFGPVSTHTHAEIMGIVDRRGRRVSDPHPGWGLFYSRARGRARTEKRSPGHQRTRSGAGSPCASSHAITGFRNTPIRSISASITSPGFR